MPDEITLVHLKMAKQKNPPPFEWRGISVYHGEYLIAFAFPRRRRLHYVCSYV